MMERLKGKDSRHDEHFIKYFFFIRSDWSVESEAFCQEHSQYKHPFTSSLSFPSDHQEILTWRKETSKVILNVGGEKHEVMWRLLERQPRSRLGLLALATTTDQARYIRLRRWDSNSSGYCRLCYSEKLYF